MAPRTITLCLALVVTACKGKPTKPPFLQSTVHAKKIWQINTAATAQTASDNKYLEKTKNTLKKLGIRGEKQRALTHHILAAALAAKKKDTQGVLAVANAALEKFNLRQNDAVGRFFALCVDTILMDKDSTWRGCNAEKKDALKFLLMLNNNQYTKPILEALFKTSDIAKNASKLDLLLKITEGTNDVIRNCVDALIKQHNTAE